MISVSDLSTLEYCRRKLYLSRTLGLMEMPKAATIRGKIVHEFHDRIIKAERDVVLSLKGPDKENILDAYTEEFSKILEGLLEERRSALQQDSIDISELEMHLKRLLKYEAGNRAECIHENIVEKNIYGEELWKARDPKLLSEQWVSSPGLGLRGRIDTVKEYRDGFIPIEMKTGNAPDEGIWPSHRLQLSAYMALLEDTLKKPVKEGIIFYVESDTKRRISMNPFLREELSKKVAEADRTLQGKLPAHVENKNKCISCSLKEICYDEERLYLLIKESSLKPLKGR